MLSIPNVITVLRLLLMPVIVWLIFERRYGVALGAFVLAAVGDMLDGFVARRLRQVSRVGALLDPAADKLTILATVATLAWQGLFPVWLAVAIVVRDVLIAGGAFAYYLMIGRAEMEPSALSKLNTFLEFGVISLALAVAAGIHAMGVLLPSLYVLVLVTVVASGIHYYWVWGWKAAQNARRF